MGGGSAVGGGRGGGGGLPRAVGGGSLPFASSNSCVSGRCGGFE